MRGLEPSISAPLVKPSCAAGPTRRVSAISQIAHAMVPGCEQVCRLDLPSRLATPMRVCFWRMTGQGRCRPRCSFRYLDNAVCWYLTSGRRLGCIYRYSLAFFLASSSSVEPCDVYVPGGSEAPRGIEARGP